MAAVWDGAEYTVTSTATSLLDVLPSTLGSRIFLSNFVILANSGNTGNVYLGKSDVTTSANRLVVLEPGDSYAVGMDSAFFGAEQVYIIGSGGQIVHITVLS